MVTLARLAVAAAFAAAATAATAPKPVPPPKRAPVDCHDAVHRSIGYWVGDWNVSDTKTSAALARSRIEWLFDGCAIKETFSQTVGPGGAPLDYRGTSYTAFNVIEQAWQQFYVDSGGTTSSFTGALDQGRLVLTAHAGPVTNRMTVSAQDDGSVRQHGEFSTDGGNTWNAGYDFTYRRR